MVWPEDQEGCRLLLASFEEAAMTEMCEMVAAQAINDAREADSIARATRRDR